MKQYKDYRFGNVTARVCLYKWGNDEAFKASVAVHFYDNTKFNDSTDMQRNFLNYEDAERFYNNFRDIDAIAFINIISQIGSDEPRNTVTKLAC
jgi:hypothetical protein